MKFNLNISDATHAEMGRIAERLDISMAGVVREAIGLFVWATREISTSSHLMVQRGDQAIEVVVPELERFRA